ncbi:hypothetical protein CTEN210_12604 [Chaetoceros tenuissimus]|uniref:Helicase-associated domain-containing protein n=1 Tax=Chaetoceros tenuissimus TaxID=426638 RepID=A0AAD3D1V1_9STRA|nr:hypothetical protein CTEN210_12604 [Chaetoceros tenuissimus]
MKSIFFTSSLLLASALLLSLDQTEAFSLSSPFSTRQSIISSSHLCMTQEQDNEVEIPSCIQSPVLFQIYPALIAHKQEYGNPNIPLGTVEGKKCKTLRRLAFQKKLSQEEMTLLEEMGFRFNSLEDVYQEADFDECLERLIEYEQQHQDNYQIPKKYKPDPELGAWVTMIRRIGRDNMDQERREKLDAIGFAWVSTRKCGSAFMKNFRPLKERLEACSKINKEGVWEVVDEDGVHSILQEEDVARWIRAQKDAADKGNLSEARCDYLSSLPGFDWRTF